VIRALKKAVKGEKLKIKTEDLKLIAAKADGSFRDGVKVLEQLASTGKTISSKRVKQLLKRGIADRKIDEWLVMVYQGKVNEALIWFGEAVEEGLDIRQFMVEVIERLREVLLSRLKVPDKADLPAIDDTEKLTDLIEEMMKAARAVKGAVIESLPVELAIVERADQLSDDRSEIAEAEESEGESKPKEKQAAKLASKSGKLNIEEVATKWRDVLAAMRPQNHSLEALLRATRPVGFDGKLLAVEVFYKFHKERLEQERYRLLVEEVASKVLVVPIRVRYYLSQRTQKVIRDKKADDNISAEVEDDVIKTAEEVFGVKVE
jgi:DNA polymerase III gamma/tau subunit